MKKTTGERTVKKRLKAWALILTAALLALFFVACAPVAEEDPPAELPPAPVEWKFKDLGTDVSLHTDVQTAFLSGAPENIGTYADGRRERSRPAPVVFEWNDVGAESYLLEVSETSDFARSSRFETSTPRAEVSNLKAGTEYFWRVCAGEEESPVASFTTSPDAPRNLYVSGVTNVRDLGGWQIENGGRVKQGRMFRCGRLNRSSTSDVRIEITDAGIATMRRDLGIRTEIDLRRTTSSSGRPEIGGITESPLGSDVNYINIPMAWITDGRYDYLNDERFLPAIREFFSVAADSANYPMIFHCNIGTDRTGLFAFLVLGLLGVSEEDLIRDYLFSNFGNIGGARSADHLAATLATVKAQEGESLAERIENCLLSIGVAQSDLDGVKAVFL